MTAAPCGSITARLRDAFGVTATAVAMADGPLLRLRPAQQHDHAALGVADGEPLLEHGADLRAGLLDAARPVALRRSDV